MLRTLRRVATAIMILTIIFTIDVTSVETKQMVYKHTDYKLVHVKFTYIDYYRNSFDINTSGKSSISSVVLSRNVDKIKISGDLQQFANGKWNTIKLWSSTANGTEHILEKEWYVSKGYYYRYKSHAYMYKSGLMVESTSYTSGSVYY